MAAESGHISFRLAQAKEHRELKSLGRTIISEIKNALSQCLTNAVDDKNCSVSQYPTGDHHG